MVGWLVIVGLVSAFLGCMGGIALAAWLTSGKCEDAWNQGYHAGCRATKKGA